MIGQVKNSGRNDENKVMSDEGLKLFCPHLANSGRYKTGIITLLILKTIYSSPSIIRTCWEVVVKSDLLKVSV